MLKGTKKQLPKSGRKDEIRRKDEFSGKMNAKLNRPFSVVNKLEKVLKIVGTVVTVAFSVYGLIPKTDKLPEIDNQRSDILKNR